MGGDSGNRVTAPSGGAVAVVRATPVQLSIHHHDGSSEPPTAVPVGQTVRLKGVPRGGGAGSYRWRTISGKIRLEEVETDTVTVIGGGQPSSAARGEEIILSYRSDDGRIEAEASVTIRVISVVFSAAGNQRQGYDDMDNAAGVKHHVSVRKNDTTTVRVVIQGGADSSVLHFVSDNTAVAEAVPPASPGRAFDLTVNGGAQNRAETAIHAHVNSEEGPVAETLMVNVYRLREVQATVAKIVDSTSSGTSLSRPNFSVANAATAINGWYRAVVGTLALTDHSSGGGTIDIDYDANNNGILELEPGTTSSELQAITAVFNPSGQKIIIVRDIVWIYLLQTAASAGDTTITLRSSYARSMRFIVDGNTYSIGVGDGAEPITIASKSGTTVTLDSALERDHPLGEGLMRPISGLSGNPIIVAEQGKTLAKERETVGHECGHSLMNWRDVDSSDNLMHYSSGRSDTRLRFKELPKRYHSGNENQWNKVRR